MKCFAVWCFLIGFTAMSSAAAEKPFAVVGRSPGHLAVQERADGPWRVIPVGGILPDVAEVRTSGAGPCEIRVATGDSLFLAPLSRVKIDFAVRRIQLLNGRIVSQAPANLMWNVQIGRTAVEATNSTVETALHPDRTISVAVSRGTGKVTVSGAEPVKLAEKTTRSWRGDQPVGDSQPLSKEQIDQLSAWTKALPPSQGPGQFVVTDPQSKSESRLTIARYHAELELRPPAALVKLDQAFYNPAEIQQEGEFVFNLPPGASVSRFAYYKNPTELVDAEIIDRRRVNSISGTSEDHRRSSTLLEQIGDDLFKIRVATVLPKEIKRILLDYVVPLENQTGQFRFQLPLNSDLDPIWDFRFHGIIHGAKLASVQSPTHPEIAFETSGPDSISFQFAKKQQRPQHDFLVTFQQPIPLHPTKFRSRVAEPLHLKKGSRRNSEGEFVVVGDKGTVKDGHDIWNDQPVTYFLAELPNPAIEAKNPAADLLVFAETSTSTRSLARVRPVLNALISNLRDQDRFRIVCVDVEPRPLHAGWLKTGSPEAVLANNQFEQQLCIGSLDFQAACQSVSKEFAELPDADTKSDRRRIVVYIGDGFDTASKESTELRSELVKRCKLDLTKAGAEFWAVDLSLPFVVPAPPLQPAAQNGWRPGMGGGMMGQGGGVFQIHDPKATKEGKAKEGSKSPSPPTGDSVLKQMASEARGRCFQVHSQHGDSRHFFEWVLAGTPSLCFVKNVRIQGDDIAAAILPEDIYYPTDLIPGDSLRISGRMWFSSKLKLSYEVENSAGITTKLQSELTAGSEPHDHLVGRYWAEQRNEHLNRIQGAAAPEGGSELALEAIVRLNREWNLLTPQTSFVILEFENEFAQWDVAPEARRKYWNWPIDRQLKQDPLTSQWLANAAPAAVLRDLEAHALLKPAAGMSTSKRIDSLLKSTRLALEAGQLETVDRSLMLLLNLRAQGRPEYRQLSDALHLARHYDSKLTEFGIRQKWFEPTGSAAPLVFGLNRLLNSQQLLPESFLQQHPLAEALMREVNFKGGRMTLDEFARWLQSRIGTSVVIDKVKLEEETISPDTVEDFPFLKRVTIYDVLSNVLGAKNLGFVAHPTHLTITTKAHAHQTPQVQFFSLQNLLDSDPQFELSELYDPLADRNQQSRQRIEQKLQAMVPISFVDANLLDLVDRYRRDLGENVIIRKWKLEEETIAVDTEDINCDFNSMRLGDGLKLILAAKGLEYRIRDGALIITTKGDSTDRCQLRIYPVQGLVHRLRTPASTTSKSDPAGMNAISGQYSFWSNATAFGMSAPAVRFSIVGKPELNDRSANEFDAVPVAVPRRRMTTGTGFNGMRLALPLDDFEQAISKRQDSDVASMQRTIMQLLGGEESGAPWQEISGEGGSLSFFFPSLSLAVRQNEQVHDDIQAHFKSLREIQSKGGLSPGSIALKAEEVVSDATSGWDALSLTKSIMGLTGGEEFGHPWQLISGEGGVLIYDPARFGIHVRQHPRTLDEINSLLVMLRRERYAALHHNARPWERPLATSSATSSFMPIEWTTQLSEQNEAVRNPVSGSATVEELELLKIRSEAVAGSWAWNDAAGESRPLLGLHRLEGGRLRMAWPGYEVRLEAREATLVAHELGYQETGLWANSVREWLDVEIPFWPHRSNRELAELFEISRVEDNNPTTLPQGKPETRSRKLRFKPAALEGAPYWIEISFDLLTGSPIEWVAISKGKVSRRFTITHQAAGATPMNLAQGLICTSADGGRGKWSTGDARSIESIVGSAIRPKHVLHVDRRTPAKEAETEFRGLADLQLGKYAKAGREFQAILDQHPDQPLIKFLLAWAMDQQEPAQPTEKIQRAYTEAINSGPREFWECLLLRGSKRLSGDELYGVLNQFPVLSRTARDELRLAQVQMGEDRPEQALLHAEAAWNKQPADADQFMVLELLVSANLRLSNLQGSVKWYTSWRDRKGPVSISQLMQLLDQFVDQGHVDVTGNLYQEILKRAEFAKLEPADRRAALQAAATSLRTNERLRFLRWSWMLTACELLPEDSPQAQTEMAWILEQLKYQERLRKEIDATDEAVRLAAQAQVPRHRLQLQAVVADRTTDVAAAVDLYWKLHQAGHSFDDDLALALTQLNRSTQYERTITIAESRLRNGRGLTALEFQPLAEAYGRLNRKDMAKRVRSVPF